MPCERIHAGSGRGSLLDAEQRPLRRVSERSIGNPQEQKFLADLKQGGFLKNACPQEHLKRC